MSSSYINSSEYLVSVYKLDYFVIPAPIFIGINSSRNPERVEIAGFPFARLRAEALWRASTGMTSK